MTIPTWEEAQKAVLDGNPTALEIFIYDYEPSGKEDALFRSRLQDLMNGIAHIYSIDKIHQPKR